jgi:hypothetical protein
MFNQLKIFFYSKEKHNWSTLIHHKYAVLGGSLGVKSTHHNYIIPSIWGWLEDAARHVDNILLRIYL